MRPDIFQFDDFLIYLKAQYQARLLEDSNYTQSKFADDLGLTQSTLSELLSKKHGLSISKARMIAAKLDLNEEETMFLCDLVQMKYGRTHYDRGLAGDRVRNRRFKSFREISHEEFLSIATIYSFIVTEALKIQSHSVDRRMVLPGLDPEKTDELFVNLEKLGIIGKQDGQWKALVQRYRVAEGGPVDSIKKFHQTLLARASEAIYEQEMAERDYRAMVMAVPKAKIPDIKARIKAFIFDLAAEFVDHKECDAVYAFGTQLFNVTPSR